MGLFLLSCLRGTIKEKPDGTKNAVGFYFHFSKKGIDKFKNFDIIHPVDAGVAHPVERHLAKVEVASSSLVARSKRPLSEKTKVFLFISYHPTENEAVLQDSCSTTFFLSLYSIGVLLFFAYTFTNDKYIILSVIGKGKIHRFFKESPLFFLVSAGKLWYNNSYGVLVH